MEKLKECPFCGGEAKLSGRNNISSVYVYCVKCGADPYIVAIAANYCANDKAIELWNKRIEDDKESTYNLKVTTDVDTSGLDAGIQYLEQCKELLDKLK
jgi:Lar family restriction alleviation protein